MTLRLGVFATHPIQYQVPIWRHLAASREVDLKVFYFSDHSIRGGIDPGFGRSVAWDLPLLEGYPSEFLSRDANLARPGSVRIGDPKSLIRKERLQTILIHGYTHGFERQLIKAARTEGCRLVMRGEFSDSGRRPWWKSWLRDMYLRGLYRRVDAFGVIGKAAARHLSRLGVPPDRQFASPYNVDDELMVRMASVEPRESAKRALGLDPNRFVVVFSGKLIARKDPVTLIRAVASIPLAERPALILVGDGELRSKVDQLASQLLGGDCLRPGFVNQTELGRYYRAGDIFVLPSRHETWGLVVNEAMYFGMALLVSNEVGCVEDLVDVGRTGYVFQVGDSGALGKKLQELIASPLNLRRMQATATQVVLNYSARNASRGILEASNPCGNR